MHRNCRLKEAIISIAVSVISVAFLKVAAPVSASEVVDEVVAVVNDEVITQGDLEKALGPIYAQLTGFYVGEELEDRLESARQEVLRRLIEAALILQEAKKQNIEVRDIEIDESIAEVKKRFPSEEEFEEALHESGLNLWDLEAKHRENIMAEKLIDREVRSRVSITPTEIATYYYGHINEFRKPDEWKVRHILIRLIPGEDDAAALEKVKGVKDGLARGEEFPSLALMYSDDAYAPEGGEMGYVKRGALLPELDEALSKLSVGEVAGPIRTNRGYHFIMAEDRRAGEVIPLADVREKINALLWKERFTEEIHAWLDKLWEKSYIVIKEPK